MQQDLECTTVEEIWDDPIVVHEGSIQVQQSRIELHVQKYEQFIMDEKKVVKRHAHSPTRFTNIVNELKSLENFHHQRLSKENLEDHVIPLGEKGHSYPRTKPNE